MDDSNSDLLPDCDKDLYDILPNPDKSDDIDPNKLVSRAHGPLEMPFIALFNESIASGVVPEVLKISRVTQIHKSGLMSDVGKLQAHINSLLLAKSLSGWFVIFCWPL